jgi:hypothetical protein
MWATPAGSPGKRTFHGTRRPAASSIRAVRPGVIPSRTKRKRPSPLTRRGIGRGQHAGGGRTCGSSRAWPAITSRDRCRAYSPRTARGRSRPGAARGWPRFPRGRWLGCLPTAAPPRRPNRRCVLHLPGRSLERRRGRAPPRRRLRERSCAGRWPPRVAPRRRPDGTDLALRDAANAGGPAIAGRDVKEVTPNAAWRETAWRSFTRVPRDVAL